LFYSFRALIIVLIIVDFRFQDWIQLAAFMKKCGV
jgi:hypothetical protein